MDDDELAKHPIFPRGNVWWVRRVVPVDLARYPGQQVRKTLDTEDRAEAIRAYPDVLRQIDLDLDRQRAELHEQGNVAGALALGKIELLNRAALEGLVLDWFDERARGMANRLPDPMDYHATNEALALLDDDAWSLAHAQPGQPEPVGAIADQLLVRAGVPAKPRRFGRVRTRGVRDLPLRGAMEHARANGLPGFAPKTVGGYMQNFSALLRWGERRRWGIAPYLTEGLIERRAVQTKRRGFEPDELERLFAGLTKYKASHPPRFWVPALAAFTGARAGEICQLHVADITDASGVKCLNLTAFDADGVR